MYLKSIWPTSHSGSASARSCQSGLPARLAVRSQAALTTAPIAMCITPFSGPSHRSWLSPIRSRFNVPGSAQSSSTDRPITWSRSASIAATWTSLPRPMVKENPCPSCPSAESVRSTTYAAE